MNKSWYKKTLLTIKDVTPHLKNIGAEIKNLTGYKSIYVFGSVSNNINNNNFIVKDIDIIIKTPFLSEDLQAINKNTLTFSSEALENQGYDKDAVKFSKKLIEINKFPLDYWAISSDKRLLHWGLISSSKKESDEIKKDAEKYASTQTGINFKKLKTSNDTEKGNWYHLYKQYYKSLFDCHTPSGWYVSAEKNIKDIIKKSIKL